MERFKPWKELVLALRSIADAIEGKSSGSEGGEIDNTLYSVAIDGTRTYFYKNFDKSKFSFDINNPASLQNINLLSDVFNQQGINMLNNILDFIDTKEQLPHLNVYGIGMFLKLDENNARLALAFQFEQENDTVKLVSDLFGSKYFETTERFSADDVIKGDDEQ